MRVDDFLALPASQAKAQKGGEKGEAVRVYEFSSPPSQPGEGSERRRKGGGSES